MLLGILPFSGDLEKWHGKVWLPSNEMSWLCPCGTKVTVRDRGFGGWDQAQMFVGAAPLIPLTQGGIRGCSDCV